MSKIGRKPIHVNGVAIELGNNGRHISYKGSNTSGTYEIPDCLVAHFRDNVIELHVQVSESASKKDAREINRLWGLHRALLANIITGASQEFEKKIVIVGLGYKAEVSGKKIVFSLGYSHKIDFTLPKDVSVSVDKSGQKLTIKSFDKELVGRVASKIKMLRLPEPYKGTGIREESEVIRRKAGKTSGG